LIFFNNNKLLTNKNILKFAKIYIWEHLILENNKKYKITVPNYKEAINNGTDFYIQFHVMDPDIDAMVIKIIYRFLEKYDILYFKDAIITVTKELINNAIKANLKRLYFKSKNLDINITDDYRSGMETFKADTYESPDSNFFDKLEQSNLVVRIAFNKSEKSIHISVINNVPIIDSEYSKINARIKKAYGYSDIAEAFGEVLDDSEGAGLGLIMGMMLFKNLGLPVGSFKIQKKNDLTISTISLPKAALKPESGKKIADEIMNEVKDIPAFPKNIMEIQKLCADPDSTIKNIAEKISLDPGLTTSILKLANSAGYITTKRVESIEDAAKIIGIKGINTLLLVTGVYKIVDSRYKKYEAIWESSYKRAFYSQNIANIMKKSKIGEFAYMAALLADIGYIVMVSIDPELFQNLSDIAGKKGIADSNHLEEISLGISHSALGALICKKWKFNEALIKAVEYHNSPYLAPDKYKELIYIVYLGECLSEIEKNKLRFEIIDEEVLDFFNLADKKSFDSLHARLKEKYSSQKDKQI